MQKPTEGPAGPAFLSGGGELGGLCGQFSRGPSGRSHDWIDPYKSTIGGKHPWALGKPTWRVWQEIWPDIGPMLDTAMRGDQGTYVESQLLIMERHGPRRPTTPSPTARFRPTTAGWAASSAPIATTPTASSAVRVRDIIDRT
jgi:hypothetical protein